MYLNGNLINRHSSQHNDDLFSICTQTSINTECSPEELKPVLNYKQAALSGDERRLPSAKASKLSSFSCALEVSLNMVSQTKSSNLVLCLRDV